MVSTRAKLARSTPPRDPIEIQKPHGILGQTKHSAQMCCNAYSHCQADIVAAQVSCNKCLPTTPLQSQACTHCQPPPWRKDSLRQTGWRPNLRLSTRKCYINIFQGWITSQCRKIKNLNRNLFGQPWFLVVSSGF